MDNEKCLLSVIAATYVNYRQNCHLIKGYPFPYACCIDHKNVSNTVHTKLKYKKYFQAPILGSGVGRAGGCKDGSRADGGQPIQK